MLLFSFFGMACPHPCGACKKAAVQLKPLLRETAAALPQFASDSLALAYHRVLNLFASSTKNNSTKRAHKKVGFDEPPQLSNHFVPSERYPSAHPPWERLPFHPSLPPVRFQTGLQRLTPPRPHFIAASSHFFDATSGVRAPLNTHHRQQAAPEDVGPHQSELRQRL